MNDQAPRSGDLKLHAGIVEEGFDDLSIAVRIPSAQGGQVLDDIRPEFVTPARYRPRKGDLMVILERPSVPLHPEARFSWLGWAWDPENIVLSPPWAATGCVDLMSQEGRVVIRLQDWDGTGATDPRVVIGAHDAAEPLTLGNLYRAWMEATLDLVDDIAEAADDLMTAISGPTVPPTDSLFAILNVLDVAATGGLNAATITAFAALVTAAASKLSTARAALVTGGASQKGTIADHLSDFVFSSKAPHTAPESEPTASST